MGVGVVGGARGRAVDLIAHTRYFQLIPSLELKSSRIEQS